MGVFIFVFEYGLDVVDEGRENLLFGGYELSIRFFLVNCGIIGEVFFFVIEVVI